MNRPRKTRPEHLKGRRKQQKTKRKDQPIGMEKSIGKMMDATLSASNTEDDMDIPDGVTTGYEPMQNTTLDMVQIVLSNSETPHTAGNTPCTSTTSTVTTVIQDSVGVTDEFKLEGDDLIKYLKDENKELMEKLEFYQNKCELLEKKVKTSVAELERVRQFYRKLFHYGTKTIQMNAKK